MRVSATLAIALGLATLAYALFAITPTESALALLGVGIVMLTGSVVTLWTAQRGFLAATWGIWLGFLIAPLSALFQSPTPGQAGELLPLAIFGAAFLVGAVGLAFCLVLRPQSKE